MKENQSTDRIHLLNEEVINQIAAGEVIERPAFLIKELFENSIDAGADEIHIEIDDGGKSITMKDNGRGISAEDLPLAIARHATSKILKADDLWGVNTFGFRGEALASIAAVSSLEIISKTREAKMGAKLVNHFGQAPEVTESGSEDGTTIKVCSLFQNTPARLKFLKSDAGEISAIKNQLKALALSHPGVAVRVLHGGDLIFFWPKALDYKERAQQVLEIEPLYANEYALDGYRAKVVVSSPHETFGTAKNIWLFVRGRYVQDRGLQTAVLDAYRNLLMHGEFPYAVIHVDCPGEDLDVNVSPTKSQVKFRNHGQAFRVVQRAVREVLEKAPWLEKIQSRTEVEPPVVVSYADSTPSFEMKSFVRSPEKIERSLSFDALEFSSSQYQQKAMPIDQFVSAPTPGQMSSHNSLKSTEVWSPLQVIGQVNLTYIVAQNDRAVIIIDQHAAHERVMFERLMAQFKAGEFEIQNFLLPITVRLDEEGVQALIQNDSDLRRYGLYVDRLGPDEVVINAAPAIIKSEALVPLVEKISAEYLAFGQSLSAEKTVSDIIATMACHSAIRAGQSLSLDEMKSLLVDMNEFSLSSFCPHGRPVYVEYPFLKLEKDFGRII